MSLMYGYSDREIENEVKQRMINEIFTYGVKPRALSQECAVYRICEDIKNIVKGDREFDATNDCLLLSHIIQIYGETYRKYL